VSDGCAAFVFPDGSSGREPPNLLKSNESPDWGFSDDDRSVTLSPLIRIPTRAGTEFLNGQVLERVSS